MVRGTSTQVVPPSGEYCQFPSVTDAVLPVIKTPTRASIPLASPRSLGSVKPGNAVSTEVAVDGVSSGVVPKIVVVVAANKGASLIGVTAVLTSTVPALMAVVPPLVDTSCPVAAEAIAPPELSISRVVSAGAGVVLLVL